MAKETWLILGASSPIARAFALEAAEHGCAVLLAGRDMDDLQAAAADIAIRTGQNASPLAFDVMDLEGMQKFADECRARATGILNVFLAIGVMPDQEAIDHDPALAHRTIAVNYLGPVSILSRLAPILEQQKAGAILALGSVAGDRGRLKNYVYGSAKAGLHVYLQGLRARLYRAHVSVTTVKPGFVDTSMTWGERLPLPPTDPTRLAKACWRFVSKGTDVAYYPWYWSPLMALVRAIPERFFKRLNF